MSAATLPIAPKFDHEASDAFAARLLQAMNDGAMVLMISLGHRVGLFDAMNGSAWLSSASIAERAGLAERYVREWLAVMTTTRVVSYRSAERVYSLPAEHSAWLTRNAVPNNLAATAQYLAGIGAIESEMVECFRSGGGLGYEKYHRFHEVMAEDSAQTVLHALFDRIVPLVDGLEARLHAGARVADVGCGQGRAMIELGGKFSASRFRGYDLCREPIDTANALARQRGLENVDFEARDLAAMPLAGPFDLITAFDAVHDQCDPQGLLCSIYQALAPGGVFLMQDIAGSSELHQNLDHPVAPLLYAVSTTHCTCVSLGQGGPGLGTLWGEELAMEMLRAAGFCSIDIRRLPHDFMNVYYICRKAAS